MRADTRLPPYLPYPRFLLQADLTQTAKLLYALLLDRATLSQSNGWLDESGRIYLVFPIEKIAAALDRSTMTVKTALSELEDAGLIKRRRSGFSKPNRIYVKLPPDGQKTFQVTDRNPSSIGTENCPTDGKKIVPMMGRKLSPNNLSSSNLNQNHMSREREAPAAYGRYKNVFLLDTEFSAASLKPTSASVAVSTPTISSRRPSLGKWSGCIKKKPPKRNGRMKFGI